MPKNITTEIESLINKVNKSLNDDLSGKNAKRFLMDIDDGLEEIEKEAEFEQKKIVERKVKELKGIINGSLSKELKWDETQNVLSKIKNGLEEAKEEIRKLEEAKKQVNLVVPTEIGRSRTPDMNEIYKTVFDNTKQNVKLGVTEGNKVFPVVGGAIGGVMGAAGGFIAGLGEGGTHLALEGAGIGAEVYENTRKGAEEVTKKVIDQGADITKQVVKNFDVLEAGKEVTKVLTSGIGHAEEVKAKADCEARIAEANAKARAEEAKAQAEVAKAQLQAQVELAKLKLDK